MDFNYLGYTTYWNKKRKAWDFNIRLSHSHLVYHEVVYDQKIENFIRCYSMPFTFLAVYLK